MANRQTTPRDPGLRSIAAAITLTLLAVTLGVPFLPMTELGHHQATRLTLGTAIALLCAATACTIYAAISRRPAKPHSPPRNQHAGTP